MNNKNILVLSPTPSHPQDAGNRKRIYALTKYLKELGATIYFVYCPREWDREIPKDAYDGMRQCWDYFFIAYPVQASAHQTNDEYFKIDAWWDVGIEFTINWISLATEFDMVICNYIFYSRVLELFDEKVTKVIDTHDIMSNRNYLLDKKLGYRDFFYVSPESEKKALDRAHLVLSIKEDESSWFECLSSTPVLTIGHLEPEPSIALDRTIKYDSIKLGFIGSANPINVKNLESFLDKYLALYGNYNELTFVVGGKVCQALDSRFSDRVRIVGMVDDVAEFYEQIDIAILPFEFSTGLKIKTVEALSWSKPCMGTINAFEGLGSNSKYHSYKTIEKLALGIKDLISDPQEIIPQLQQDSELVFSSYSNNVKEAIAKLYQADWKTIKELQSSSNTTLEIEAALLPQKTYNFNIITNVDFWDANTNESLWINFWIERARRLGNVNIYRTQNFKDIDSDKLELYKLGLVDNVHQRELYQIVDLFKISPDDNVAFINLIDFSSIIRTRLCLQELDQITLAKNHFLWYFFNRSTIDANSVITENVDRYLDKSDRLVAVNFWDLNSKSTNGSFDELNVSLTSNPINLNSNRSKPVDLDRVIVAAFCIEESSITELDKLVRCCQDLLPQHFELMVFSDLDAVRNKYNHVYSTKKAEDMIDRIDILVCLSEPKAISFLIYLAVCKGIPIYCKEQSFVESLATENAHYIANFTSIPEAYKSFLERSVFSEQADSNLSRHQSWELFVEYWITQAQTNIVATDNNYITV